MSDPTAIPVGHDACLPCLPAGTAARQVRSAAPASSPTITTVEGALELVAQTITSPKFAEHVRKNLATGMDLSFVVTIKHVKDRTSASHAHAVTLHYRRKTPACPLLVIQHVM